MNAFEPNAWTFEVTFYGLADGTADVGFDNQTPIALGTGCGPEETQFTGRIHKVTLDVQ